MSCGKKVFVPLGFEKGPEVVAGLPHRGIVLVERLAVVEHQVEVVTVVLLRFVGGILQLFVDGGEIHGFLDDLPVGGELSSVYRKEERPRVLVGH